jgi:RimJ/RimL family protein N-acetyltransferase
MTVPTLRTSRLVLQAPRLRDARVVTKALNNFAVSRWLTVVPFPYGITDAQWFIQECERGAFAAWFIRADDDFVGAIGLDDGLGYWLAQDVWGNGYAYEAARAVVAHHFGDGAASDLNSSYFEGNMASQHVLTKLGFIDAGAKTHFSKARNGEVAARRMLLTRQVWEKSHGA